MSESRFRFTFTENGLYLVPTPQKPPQLPEKITGSMMLICQRLQELSDVGVLFRKPRQEKESDFISDPESKASDQEIDAHDVEALLYRIKKNAASFKKLIQGKNISLIPLLNHFVKTVRKNNKYLVQAVNNLELLERDVRNLKILNEDIVTTLKKTVKYISKLQPFFSPDRGQKTLFDILDLIPLDSIPNPRAVEKALKCFDQNNDKIKTYLKKLSTLPVKPPKQKMFQCVETVPVTILPEIEAQFAL